MPVVSADTLQLSIVPETVPGTTPSNPVFDIVRTTGESLTFSPNTSESGELGGTSRSQKPATVTGQSISGDINFELAKAAWFDRAISGVVAAEWGECPLTSAPGGAVDSDDRIVVGNKIQTFTVEKRFPDPENPGQYLYQWYRGVTFSVLSLTITPNESVTGSVSVVGGVPELGSAAIAGATYISAGTSAVFTAPEVTELSVGSDIAVGTHCWTTLTINIDSQNRGIPCIGSTGDRETVLGTLTASMSGDVYFQDQDILQALLDNATVGDSSVVLKNADMDVYRFDFLESKPTAGQLTAGGTGQDLTIPLTLEPTPIQVCDDGSQGWDSGIIISQVDTAPSVRSPITANASAIVANSSTITIGGGPADVPYTLTITTEVDSSGTPVDTVVAISKNDSINTIVGKIINQFPEGGSLETANATYDTVDIVLGTAVSLDACDVTVAPT